MTSEELYQINKRWFSERAYQFTYWDEFDYSILNHIMYRHYSGRKHEKTCNEVFIMADTETSKKRLPVEDNHVVAFTISLLAYDRPICTIWGRRPDDFCEAVIRIMDNMRGYDTIIYFHNLSYDYVFLRKFLFKNFGLPINQLATKSHYPINIEFECGLIIKDSLILGQRSLEKWAKDLNVEHKKAVGQWDYSKIRTQHEIFTATELEYIEHDTLAGVECLNALCNQLNKHVNTMPYTATGIPREDVRKLAKENRGHDAYIRQALTYQQYLIAEQVYHGGYTHGNRHEIGWINPAICYDFASSYPYVLLSERYPAEKFAEYGDRSVNDILQSMDTYAFMFRFCVKDLILKSDDIIMPAFQYSKTVKIVNPIIDNGRILKCDYAEIYLTEQDLFVINNQYTWSAAICTEVMAAYKDYLPRWLTDYIFQLFTDKTRLKGGDPVLYALAKAKLNSIYGMMVQKVIRDDIQEDYITGLYEPISNYNEESYNAAINKRNMVLPYQWGIWVTAYAFRNLFDLGSCVAEGEVWLYSDTDSAYATGWDQGKLQEYNNKCKEKLKSNGYGCVEYNGREYWLGVAEFDGSYSEFIVQGAKRYCGRSEEDGKLHITVAGVPKSGARCLGDDISNFRPGMIFDGVTTGKLQHKYIFVDDIYTDEEGNITADSVDLSPCDYELDSINIIDWEQLITEDVEVQVYDEQ